jgi:serine protease Do
MPPPPPHHPDHPGGPGHGDGKPSTFLGLGTATTSPALTDQLGLPPDTGVLVMDVVAGSPADGKLKQNDVLTKLDDQLLMDPQQLAALIRMHHKGDSVSLTYIRGGKTAAVTVELSEHTAPHHMVFRMEHGPLGMHGDHKMIIKGHDPMSVDGHLVLKDEELRLELNVAGGKKMLVATDANGKEIFNGPIDTPQQREELPPEVKHALQRIEHMHLNDGPPSPEVRAESMARPPKAAQPSPLI